MKRHIDELSPAELEAKLALNRAFLRAALAVSGSSTSTPEATAVAGAEAGRIKAEIRAIEEMLAKAA